MKKVLAAISAILILAACSAREERAAYGVIKRTFGEVPGNVSLKYEGLSEGADWYSLEVAGGTLTVGGSSVVALCKGFHDYIQDNGYGSATWSGARLDLPSDLPDLAPVKVESHPLMRMQRWLDMAGESATCEAERQEFRAEALRLVTTWDAEDIHDYAARCWSGLLRDYYVPHPGVGTQGPERRARHRRPGGCERSEGGRTQAQLS